MIEKQGKSSVYNKSSLQKAWEVLFPYLLYYLAYNAAYLILAFAYQATVNRFGGTYGQFMTAHAATVAGVMGGICMLAGILPLVPMFKEELYERRATLRFAGTKAGAADAAAAKAGEVTAGRGLKEEATAVGRAGVRNRSGLGAEEAGQKLTVLVKEKPEGGKESRSGWTNTGMRLTAMVRQRPQSSGSMIVLTAILACSVSLGLNALLTLTGFANGSQTYQEVADRQYGVAFAAGLVLYGLVSPLAEEVVFRGVVYNRLRRLYNPVVGIVASGVLFGVFHGNLVQGVYGACLGMLMAWLYEKSGKFVIPFLFHAVANLAVYTTARMEGVQGILFTPAGCAVLLAVSAMGIMAVHWCSAGRNISGNKAGG